jgi:Cu+-exporting ATPase
MTELKLKLIVGIVLSVLNHVGSTLISSRFSNRFLIISCLLALLVMTTPVVFWVGSRFFIGAYKAALQRTTGHEHPRSCGRPIGIPTLSW